MSIPISLPGKAFSAHEYRAKQSSCSFWPINDETFLGLIKDKAYTFYFNKKLYNDAPLFPMQRISNPLTFEALELVVTDFFNRNEKDFVMDPSEANPLAPVILANAYMPFQADGGVMPCFGSVALYYRTDLSKENLGAFAGKKLVDVPEVKIYNSMCGVVGPSQRVLELAPRS